MIRPVIFSKNLENQLEAEIYAVSDWEGFDKLIGFIVREYQAEILKKCDGPDARRCILSVLDCQIELIHDDMFGNYILSPTTESEDVVKKIGLELERRLSDVN